MADSSATPTCALCGGPLDEYDFDRGTCHDCLSPAGKLADLEIALRASGDTPDRIREWPVIRHLLRKRFGENRSDGELWERFTDWLCAEGGFQPDVYLTFPLDYVSWLLEKGVLRDDQAGPEKLREGLRAVQRELKNWNRSKSPRESGHLVEDVPTGHPLHSAVVQLYPHYGGLLPKPARSYWRRFLKIARTDDAEADDEAARLSEWVRREIRARTVGRQEGEKSAKARPTNETRQPATANERMAGTIMENPDAMGWNSPQWAKYLKCGRSTVVQTATWKKLESARLSAKAERMKDRRRKPKASDSRRD